MHKRIAVLVPLLIFIISAVAASPVAGEMIRIGNDSVPLLSIQPKVTYNNCTQYKDQVKDFDRIALGCTTQFGCLTTEHTVAQVRRCSSTTDKRYYVTKPETRGGFQPMEGGWVRGKDVSCYRPSYYRINRENQPGCLSSVKPTISILSKYNNDDKTVTITAEFTPEPGESMPTPKTASAAIKEFYIETLAGQIGGYDKINILINAVQTEVRGSTLSISGTIKPRLTNVQYKAFVRFGYLFPLNGETAQYIFTYPPTATATAIRLNPPSIDLGNIPKNSSTEATITVLPVCIDSEAVVCKLPKLTTSFEKNFKNSPLLPHFSATVEQQTTKAIVTVNVEANDMTGAYKNTLIIRPVGITADGVPTSLTVVEKENAAVKQIMVAVNDAKGNRPLNPEDVVPLMRDTPLTLIAKAKLANEKIDDKKIRWSVDIPELLQSNISSQDLGNGKLTIAIIKEVSGEHTLRARAQYDDDMAKQRVVDIVVNRLPLCRGNQISIAPTAAGVSTNAFSIGDFLTNESSQGIEVKKDSSQKDCRLETERVGKTPYVNIGLTLQGGKRPIPLPQLSLYDDGGEIRNTFSDLKKNDGIFSATIPASSQTNDFLDVTDGIKLIKWLSPDANSALFESSASVSLKVDVLDSVGKSRSSQNIQIIKMSGTKALALHQRMTILHNILEVMDNTKTGEQTEQAITKILRESLAPETPTPPKIMLQASSTTKPVIARITPNLPDTNGQPILAEMFQDSSGQKTITLSIAALYPTIDEVYPNPKKAKPR